MAGTLLLGIDLGTTTCRAAIFDRDGQQRSAASAETAVRYPRPLWAEVDPEVWWRGVASVVREALDRGSVAPEQIAAVGVSGLMHAPVLLDEHGVPVVPAQLWMDQRCAPQCEALRREAAQSGLHLARELASTVTGPKLRWLAEMEPDSLQRARWLLLPKDYIRYRLCGATGTDPSDAGGTGLFDRQTGTWRWELVDLCRVPRALMPAINESAAPAGVVSAAAARATGLAAGTPVAFGGSDTLCTRLGAGPLAPGEACLYLGTAAWVAISGRGAAASSSARPASGGGAPTRAFGATSTTGATLRWLRDLLVPDDLANRGAAGVFESYEALTQLAEAVPLGSEGLLFFPHLMGERGPVADPQARGAFVGLTLRHGRGHLVRAVLEGTAFHLRRLIEARAGEVRPESVVACGGVAHSAVWMQILADVLQLPLRVPAVAEAAVLGAAMLGGAAAGLHSVEEAPLRMVRPGPFYRADATHAAQYDARYERYCRLDDTLAPWYQDQ